MGKGNCCVLGEYEGLYFIDWSNFNDQYEDDEGNSITDYDLQRFEWENSLEQFIIDFTAKYKSFYRCDKDKWINRNEKAILENELFYIITEDNDWSMAIKLIQKEQDYYSNGNIKNLQARHYKNYLNGIRDCLFNQFEEINTYAGAWTSGTLRKEDI